MLVSLNRNNISVIENPVFADYASRYLSIYDSFINQVEAFGLPFSDAFEEETEALRKELDSLGISKRNDGASLVCHAISDACSACRTGVGSYTGFLSLMCHRRCYYCFNPNQEEFETYAYHKKDWQSELAGLYQTDRNLRQIALTGGEPLLHKDDMIAYFAKAREYWPKVYMRLYTSGDLLDTTTFSRLQAVGLNEIRFSLKLEDDLEKQNLVFAKIEEAKSYIPNVLVEMPVLPGTEDDMIRILDRLEALKIFGINLLEFCFPYVNAPEFVKRGFALRYPPYKTLYNFWYAGGLPVAGSELLALKLLRYVSQKKYRLNVHYCSLENKHFGQIYMQNTFSLLTDQTYLFSQKDFYLKTAKAFGNDIRTVEWILKKNRCTDYKIDQEYHFIQFSPSYIPLLTGKNPELGISYNVKEYRDGQEVIRELRLDYTRPSQFTADDI